MYLLLMTVIILLVLFFIIGLFLFVRFLILKRNRNIGYGIFGLLIMILAVLVIIFQDDIINYESKSDFIHEFENVTELSYPASGKIIERYYNGGTSYFSDYERAAIIEMDSMDYERILRDVQSGKNFELDSIALIKYDSVVLKKYELDSIALIKYKITPTSSLKKQISGNDFDCVFRKKHREYTHLWFHKNKQIIFYEDIKN